MTMNPQIPAQHLPARHRRWPGVLGTSAVVVVLIALAAATFMLSYNGIHVLALNSGVSPRLARIYPGILDAALVIACLAALMLREGKWWARWYAWLAIIVMVVVGAGTNAIHAMNVPLPRRETAGVISAAPWLLLLLAFSLWLTTLRQSRARRSARSAGIPVPGVPAPEVAGTVPEVAETVPAAETAPAEETTPAAEVVRAEVVQKDDVPAEALGANAREASAEAPEASAVDAPAAEGVAPEAGGPETEAPEADAPQAEPEAVEAGSSAEPQPESEPAVEADAATGDDAAAPAPSADESAEEESPSSGQVAVIRSRPVDYWDAGEGDILDAGLVPAVHDRTDPAPAPELPFFSAPALRRMRSTPVPPEEEDLADQP